MGIPVKELMDYSLIDAMRARRSRRFGMGMKMEMGALAFESHQDPLPLTEEEEALLAFAACGITGYALAELVYAPGYGDIMSRLVARSVASGDCAQTVAVAITNDEATYLIKRPQDLAADEIQDIIRLVGRGDLTEFYKRVRVKIKDGRSAPSLDPMYNIPCNTWSLYQPGTTYFIPINDLTFIYINGLLSIFSPTTGAYILDERENLRPAGLERFAASNGGHLNDNPQADKILTIQRVEVGLAEIAAIEQGMMFQNMALMCEAMGLGGFPNFAYHEFAWFEALGFRMEEMPASKYFNISMLYEVILSLLNKDEPVPYPVALESGDRVLLRGHCPPMFPTMRDAVMAVVETKFGGEGTFRGGVKHSTWRTPSTISDSIPDLSEEAIEATVGYCEYIYDTYERFPAFVAPFRTVLGFQAAHLDVDFYDKYYRPEALSPTHREHMARWHK
jgi:hypothetical protein